MNIMKKKVLLISYNYPPIREAQAVRWAFLSKWLYRQGWEVDVVTINLPEYYTYLSEFIPAGIGLYRTYSGPLQDIFFKLKARAKVEDNEFKAVRTKTKIRVLRSIYRAIRHIANIVLIPDLRTEWLPFGFSCANKLLKLKKYDLIVSSHEPGVSHLIAYYLKKIHKIPWIADFGDPWVAQHTPIFRKFIDRYVERKFIEDIDGFIFTNENTIEMYKNTFSSLKSKRIIKISQGYDSEVINQILPQQLPQDSLNIVYTGTFYKKLREPYEFLQAIYNLNNKGYRIKLYLAGNIFDEFINYISMHEMNDFVNYLGFLDYKDTISLQRGASLLLYIGNDNNIQTPGKFYEYLGSERPIFMVQNHLEDAVVDLIEKYNRGIKVNNKKSAIENELKSIYELWENNKLDCTFNTSPIKEYSFESHAEQIIREFNNLIL